jgi:Glycoside hydrolase family 44
MRSVAPLAAAALTAALVTVVASPGNSSAVRRTATTGVTLTVDAAHGRHRISPLVYGVDFASQVSGLGQAFRVPVDRWGGNSTSRYNYTNNTYNTGSDYYFENIVAGGEGTLGSLIRTDRNRHSKSLVTVPMLGWVSKSSPSEHPFTCSFPRTVFPAQNSFDFWDSNCGNGVNGGTNLSADPATTSTAVGPDFVQQMVQHLVSSYGTAAHGGVRFYGLDNEPDLWNSTHRDVHPDPLTATELWSKSHAAARAVEDADPTADVVGPSDWGWCAYYYSAVDNCGSSTADRDAHGGLPLGRWYLERFAKAQRTGGTRLLDYFDEHFYPQESGVALSPAGSDTTQALRLRSTRSLWDPTYVDESWISDANGGKPLTWIRTMRDWVRKSYPGTKTAITEYNWGALDSMNGALAQADVLGIFGRERLGLGTLWGPAGATDPWAYAFRMYRDYDGHGGQFGSTSVRAVSGDQGRLAVYAATRGSHGALTMMVINKSGSSIRSAIVLRHFAAGSNARLFRYSSADLHQIVRAPAVAMDHGRLTTTYPADSITLLVLPRR